MRKLSSYLVLAALLAGPVATTAQDEEDGDVKYRQSVMKAVAGHAGAIAQIAKGNVAHGGYLQAHTNALAALSIQVPAAFKANKMVGKHQSKPEIWSDWSGFEAKSRDFENAAQAVAAAAKSGGAGAVGAELKGLFDSCKGCHKEYREKKK